MVAFLFLAPLHIVHYSHVSHCVPEKLEIAIGFYRVHGPQTRGGTVEIPLLSNMEADK